MGSSKALEQNQNPEASFKIRTEWCQHYYGMVVIDEQTSLNNGLSFIRVNIF